MPTSLQVETADKRTKTEVDKNKWPAAPRQTGSPAQSVGSPVATCAQQTLHLVPWAETVLSLAHNCRRWRVLDWPLTHDDEERPGAGDTWAASRTGSRGAPPTCYCRAASTRHERFTGVHVYAVHQTKLWLRERPRACWRHPSWFASPAKRQMSLHNPFRISSKMVVLITITEYHMFFFQFEKKVNATGERGKGLKQKTSRNKINSHPKRVVVVYRSVPIRRNRPLCRLPSQRKTLLDYQTNRNISPLMIRIGLTVRHFRVNESTVVMANVFCCFLCYIVLLDRGVRNWTSRCNGDAGGGDGKTRSAELSTAAPVGQWLTSCSVRSVD